MAADPKAEALAAMAAIDADLTQMEQAGVRESDAGYRDKLAEFDEQWAIVALGPDSAAFLTVGSAEAE